MRRKGGKALGEALPQVFFVGLEEAYEVADRVQGAVGLGLLYELLRPLLQRHLLHTQVVEIAQGILQSFDVFNRLRQRISEIWARKSYRGGVNKPL